MRILPDPRPGSRHPDLLDAHPGLELELNSSDRLSDLVEAGIDCVIRVGAYADPSMIARPLAQLRQVTCASPGVTPSRGDTMHTYPLLLTAAGTEIAVRAVEDALAGRLQPQPPAGEPSWQWYHPTVWRWLWTGVTRGIW